MDIVDFHDGVLLILFYDEWIPAGISVCAAIPQAFEYRLRQLKRKEQTDGHDYHQGRR